MADGAMPPATEDCDMTTYRIRRDGRIETTTDARVAQQASRDGARVTAEVRG